MSDGKVHVSEPKCPDCGGDMFGALTCPCWDDDSDDPDCTMCGGDGYVECWDTIQCTRRHVGGMCPCGACGGSGLAKDQTIW